MNENICICKLRFTDDSGIETIGKEEDTTSIKFFEFDRVYQIIKEKINN